MRNLSTQSGFFNCPCQFTKTLVGSDRLGWLIFGLVEVLFHMADDMPQADSAVRHFKQRTATKINQPLISRRERQLKPHSDTNTRAQTSCFSIEFRGKDRNLASKQHLLKYKTENSHVLQFPEKKMRSVFLGTRTP